MNFVKKNEFLVKNVTSCVLPSGMACTVGENSTMYSQMERRQSISRFHIDLFSGDGGCNLLQVPNTVAAGMMNKTQSKSACR